MKRILITGAAGFIGHHVVEHILKNTDWEIVTLDRLSVSGNWNRFTDLEIWPKEGHRVKGFVHDLRCEINEWVAKEIGHVDYILHMAASTHVDRSITDPMGFVLDNVVGTTNLLQFARKQKDNEHDGHSLKAFVYFSTDEVFGPAPQGTAYQEWNRYNSGNPYAAAKAGGEEMALAFANTYGIPVMITHTMNVFGERQHPEKFIPLVINKVLRGETVMIHANKEKTQAGSRFWIHARNVAGALLFLLERQELGEPNVLPRPTFWRMPNADKYNIVGEREVDNLEMAQTIARILRNLPEMHTMDCPRSGDTGMCSCGADERYQLQYQMTDFHSSRPGHDLRYALDGGKMKDMGWSPPVGFEDSLRSVIEWTIKHNNWL